jgi:hypothetical protein
MEKQQKRPSIREINAEMDAIIKRKPTKQQIEELGDVIRKINEENESTDSAIDPRKKIARSPDDSFIAE